MMIRLPAGLGLLLLGLLGSVPAAEPERPHIHTSRPSPQILPLPKDEDSFHFVIFGDRTGGPAEGIKVLARAVEDANLLDPDLVMTVGDLVNGYNQTDVWLRQMEEYRSTMGRLRMPWFPVAGNHDIYWRPAARFPEAKPAREHEESYEKHFGPLWYWFEHKNTGFLVLFSDEGHPDGRQRDFGDQAQQQVSRTQLDWMAAELVKMKRLRHVFVFLHHPYWWNERYPGSNWDEVHRLLVKNGNVRAVIAGHIHQMRYDGVRDGIGYYALATTGGSLTPGMEYEYFGLLHQFNVVTVRSNGFSMASIPVGGVFDPRQFTPDRLAEVEAARYLLHDLISPPLRVSLNGSVTATQQVAITNPCSLPIEVTVVAKGDRSWILAPDHRHTRLEPEQGRVFDFACVRQSTNGLEGYASPEFELRFDVLTPEARLAMPLRSLRARSQVEPGRGGWPRTDGNHALELNGTNACLEVERAQLLRLPSGPFSVEAWVKPSNDTNGAIVANLKVGGFSLDVAGTPRFLVQTDDAGVDARRAANLKPQIVAAGRERLRAGHWVHLAGVYDGATITLFVNGKKAASASAPGARLTSDKSLYIGARPHGAWNVHNFSSPLAFFRGTVDDVRVSRGARYSDDFTPARILGPDDQTLILFAHDQLFGPFSVAQPGSTVQAMVHGGAKLVPATR